MKQHLGFLLLAGSLFILPTEPIQAAEAPEPFEIFDGDRIALVGDTLIERENEYGYIESFLTLAFPDRRYTFRNLGWSGDLPNGRSRASFDWNKPESVWFQRLTNQVASVLPTVVFLGYGMAASFQGEAGLDDFREDLVRLMDAIQANAGTGKVRFVLMSPIGHQNLGSPLGTGAGHQEKLELYADAIQEIAEAQGARYVHLLSPNNEEPVSSERELVETSNGIHLTRYGYYLAAEVVLQELGLTSAGWRASVLKDGTWRDGSSGSEREDLVRTENTITFSNRPNKAMPPVMTGPEGNLVGFERIRLQFIDMPEGDYSLLVDGTNVLTTSHFEWKQSRAIVRGPEFEQGEALRQAILKKNELFFHQWRPQNQTYLFGFRKHEQGQNAAEIEEFDRLIAEWEERIHELKQPRFREYRLVPASQAELAPVAPEAGPEKLQIARLEFPQQHEPLPMPEFDLDEGFEINLFAEDPLLTKPIQMNFDPAGRLWIATSETYPQIKPGSEANDKIIVLDDTNGDGVADSSKVFADGLLIPTGVMPGDGGAYVANSTQLLFFEDRDGDQVADAKKVLLSGFGTEDTHHILHSFRWGLDGRLYMNQSIYIHSHIETPYGVERLNSGGIWAFRPATYELEVFLKGFCNPWGHHFDEYGQSFVTDGAGFQGISYGVPGAMYFTYAGGRRLLDSISPGAYPKFSGLEIIHSEHFPSEWQGRMITCDFRAHRIVNFEVNEQGAGYASRELPDFIRTSSVNFRPIDVKLGPDGALYIADWSNPIIQHGEVDFRDERRDKVHGRIWRVTAKNRPLVSRKNFPELPARELLDLTLSENVYDQENARRVLVERRFQIRSELDAWTDQLTEEKDLLQSLWVHQSIDLINPPLLERLLEAEDGRVRAAATRVLSLWQDWIDGSEGLLARQVEDSHPRVKLEAVRGVARTPSIESLDLVLGVTEGEMDKFLEYAVWLSVNDLSGVWVEAVEDGAWNPDGKIKQLEYGLNAIEPEPAQRILGLLLPEQFASDGSGPWIELVGTAGKLREIDRLFQQLLNGGFNSQGAGRALSALNQAARLRNLKPSGDRSQLVRFMSRDAADDVRRAAIEYAGRLDPAGAVLDRLLQIASAPATAQEDRLVAIQSVREAGGDRAIDALIPLCVAPQPLETRQAATAALATLAPNRAIPHAVEILNSIQEESAALAFWRQLLSIRGFAGQLASGLPESGLNPVMATAGLRAAREGGREETTLVTALSRGAGLQKSIEDMTDEDLKRIARQAEEQGDPHRGEQVYRRPELACVTCHAIGGIGGKVGPDLTSIGASAPMDYLVESMWFPNRKIKEGYHSVIVETTDELEYSGILVRETDEQLLIRNAANVEVAVPKTDVASMNMGASLMPSGLIDLLSEQERLDLYKFMSQLGKPGPFDASRADTARIWKLRAASHRDEQFGSNMQELMEAGDWTVVPARVDGRLMKEQMAEALDHDNPNRATSMVGLWARTRIQLGRPDTISLKLEGVEDAKLWVNDDPVEITEANAIQLPAGDHSILLKLTPSRLPEYLRVSSQDATFLTQP